MSSPHELGDGKTVTAVASTPTSEEAGEIIPTTTASNGNLIDDGLQRGLKNRHLVS